MNLSRRAYFQLATVIVVVAFAASSSAQAGLARLSKSEIRILKECGKPERGGVCLEKHVVQFRLEVGTYEGIYLLLSGPKGSAPMGIWIEKVSGKVVWTEPRSGRTFSTPPSLKLLGDESGSRWIYLPPSAVYQWDAIQPVASGERSAGAESLKVLIRDGMSREPIEVSAPWY
jgi:hypothetical protein